MDTLGYQSLGSDITFTEIYFTCLRLKTDPLEERGVYNSQYDVPRADG